MKSGKNVSNSQRRSTVPITNTQELFLHELAEIYDAEHRFLEGQAVMVDRVTDDELQSSIRNHILQTRQHIRNLEQVFRELGEESRRETNEVAQGLVSEAQTSMQETESDVLRDCAIDAAVIKVEHFEIASYRSLVTGARLMGQSKVVDLLNANLGQEEETAQIAEQSAEKLLQEAMQAEEPEPEGLVDKIKDKFTGQ
jgi:ferritin-like metal-binding protein YciE